MRYALGIDLGTATVAAAVARGGAAESVLLGERSAGAPVAVHLTTEGTLLTGDAALRRAKAAPERTALHLRRRLDDPPVLLGGVPYPAADLLAAVLRDVADTVAAAGGGPPSRTVLTRPAHWSARRVARLREIAAAAGLEAGTVTDAEAAATRWAEARGLPQGGLVAVYDLGAGRFDAAVLVRRGRGMAFAGPPEGLERVGGLDFDEAVLGHVDYRTGGALGALDLQDPAAATALARLREECMLARESLTRDLTTAIPVYLPGRAPEEVELTRAELDLLLRAPLESTLGALTRVVQGARVQPRQLAAVLLVGGATRMPVVARLVSETLAGVPVESPGEQVVALGAALLAEAGAAAPAPGAAGPRQSPALAPDAPVGPVAPVGPAPPVDPKAPAGTARPPVPPNAPSQPASVVAPVGPQTPAAPTAPGSGSSSPPPRPPLGAQPSSGPQGPASAARSASPVGPAPAAGSVPPVSRARTAGSASPDVPLPQPPPEPEGPVSSPVGRSIAVAVAVLSVLVAVAVVVLVVVNRI